MESIETKVSDSISDIRNLVESSDAKSKTKILKEIDYVEEKFEDIINYIYAQVDNLEDLKESLEME